MSSSQLSIAIQEPDIAGYSFRTFDSYQEFRRWHLGVQDSSHYEIIHGRQNLYFDFDGDLNVEELTEAIKRRYQELERTIGHSLPIRVDIYSSCDIVKKSYHVVVKGVCFKDHLACGRIAREVVEVAKIMNSTNPEWISAFDGSVYSAKRNLRLLGSRKLNSTRVKIFSETSYKSSDWFVQDKSATCLYNDQLFLSLVSCAQKCRPVDLGVIVPQFGQMPINPNPRDSTRYEPVRNQSWIADALQLVNDLLPGVFSQREIRGQALFLRRNKPAMCPVCERLHESDNAYVFLRRDGLFFVCMRNTSRSLPLQSDEEVILPLIVVKKESAQPFGPLLSRMEIYAQRVVRRWSFV